MEKWKSEKGNYLNGDRIEVRIKMRKSGSAGVDWPCPPETGENEEKGEGRGMEQFWGRFRRNTTTLARSSGREIKATLRCESEVGEEVALIRHAWRIPD